jgi:hypothetical protein
MVSISSASQALGTVAGDLRRLGVAWHGGAKVHEDVGHEASLTGAVGRCGQLEGSMIPGAGSSPSPRSSSSSSVVVGA